MREKQSKSGERERESLETMRLQSRVEMKSQKAGGLCESVGLYPSVSGGRMQRQLKAFH